MPCLVFFLVHALLSKFSYSFCFFFSLFFFSFFFLIARKSTRLPCRSTLRARCRRTGCSSRRPRPSIATGTATLNEFKNHSPRHRLANTDNERRIGVLNLGAEQFLFVGFFVFFFNLFIYLRLYFVCFIFSFFFHHHHPHHHCFLLAGTARTDAA